MQIFNIQAATYRNRFSHRFINIFSHSETSRARSEYHEYLFYHIQLASALIVVISGARCRPCPNFKAASRASDEELAKIDCRFGIYVP